MCKKISTCLKNWYSKTKDWFDNIKWVNECRKAENIHALPSTAKIVVTIIIILAMYYLLVCRFEYLVIGMGMFICWIWRNYLGIFSLGPFIPQTEKVMKENPEFFSPLKDDFSDQNIINAVKENIKKNYSEPTSNPVINTRKITKEVDYPEKEIHKVLVELGHSGFIERMCIPNNKIYYLYPEHIDNKLIDSIINKKLSDEMIVSVYKFVRYQTNNMQLDLDAIIETEKNVYLVEVKSSSRALLGNIEKIITQFKLNLASLMKQFAFSPRKEIILLIGFRGNKDEIKYDLTSEKNIQIIPVSID